MRGSMRSDGNLTIRGQTRPQKLMLTMKDPTHVEGTAQILLSTFGIERLRKPESKWLMPLQ